MAEMLSIWTQTATATSREVSLGRGPCWRMATSPRQSQMDILESCLGVFYLVMVVDEIMLPRKGQVIGWQLTQKMTDLVDGLVEVGDQASSQRRLLIFWQSTGRTHTHRTRLQNNAKHQRKHLFNTQYPFWISWLLQMCYQKRSPLWWNCLRPQYARGKEGEAHWPCAIPVKYHHLLL